MKIRSNRVRRGQEYKRSVYMGRRDKMIESTLLNVCNTLVGTLHCNV